MTVDVAVMDCVVVGVIVLQCVSRRISGGIWRSYAVDEEVTVTVTVAVCEAVLVLGRAVVRTVRCVSMQVQTDPTKLFACKSKELSTTEAVGLGVAEGGLLVVVTARLFRAANAVTYE